MFYKLEKRNKKGGQEKRVVGKGEGKKRPLLIDARVVNLL